MGNAIVSELTPGSPEQGDQSMPSPKRKPPRKREWQPPRPECEYLRLVDFPHLYQIPASTTFRLAKKGKLPYIEPPGTRLMLFPRARVERIISSWQANGRRKRT